MFSKIPHDRSHFEMEHMDILITILPKSSGKPMRHRHKGSFEGPIRLPLIRTTASNHKPLSPFPVRSQKSKISYIILESYLNSSILLHLLYLQLPTQLRQLQYHKALLLDSSNWCRISWYLFQQSVPPDYAPLSISSSRVP
jgi:hypothetical protein